MENYFDFVFNAIEWFFRQIGELSLLLFKKKCSQSTHTIVIATQNFCSTQLLFLYFQQDILDSICFSQTKLQLSTQALPQFSVQFQSFLRNNLSVLQKNINMSFSQTRNTFCGGNSQAINDNDANETLLGLIEEVAIESEMLIVKMNAMCILYHHLFGNLDQKLFAAVVDANKKVRFQCFSEVLPNIRSIMYVLNNVL